MNPEGLLVHGPRPQYIEGKNLVDMIKEKKIWSAERVAIEDLIRGDGALFLPIKDPTTRTIAGETHSGAGGKRHANDMHESARPA